MLPGPPNECRPMFDEVVLPLLKQENYFSNKKIYRWLTLGLAEGEIATQVDNLAKPYAVEIGYRWNYPYLEIKISSDDEAKNKSLIDATDKLLKPNCVSRDGKNAIEMLEAALREFPSSIGVVDELTDGRLALEIKNPNLQFNFEKKPKILFVLKSSKLLNNQTEFSGSLMLTCIGHSPNHADYKHETIIANRGAEVLDYAKQYAAWQLYRFIQTLRQ